MQRVGLLFVGYRQGADYQRTALVKGMVNKWGNRTFSAWE
jgi:hypothetical protein